MLNKIRPVFLFLATFVLASTASAPTHASSGPSGFADLAEKLLPAVVNISTTQTINSKDELFMQDFPDLQVPPGSPFEDFFQEFMNKKGKRGEGNKETKRKATSLGSGFVVDPSGYIVTNNHVIQDADEITVILQDDTNLVASVVGHDKKTDLALLKVTPKKSLVSVSWGDSDKIRVGDWIMAIGNPFGLGGTVTTGIISARARDINSGPYDDYLQTDAPINRGNSGGPMFDMDGKVIGVNTAIFSPSGGSIGIGFAVPSSMAKSVIDQLKAHGHTRRGWLGVRIQLVTPEIAESLGMSGAPRGALVSGVTPGGPAAQAKIEPGDVIVGFDGKDVNEMRRLPRIVAETDVDRTVPITVFRKGKELSLQVKVGELESNDEAQKDEEKEAKISETHNAEKVDEIGAHAAPISDALRKQFDIKKEVKGLVVVNVSANGIAAEQGIMAGDVISEASQQEVATVAALNEMIQKAKKDNKPLLLLVDRKNELRFVAISFAKKAKKDKE
ncbi:MAG: DegQ family serine endoprotease [Alphaproteobacteria bacterium]|nr:DegQ family serine endoprotease [Alphaproteobacteria bacterium]